MKNRPGYRRTHAVLGVLMACIGVASSLGDVMITEFLAHNTTGIRDEDDERSDWIELYNSGSTPVNLSGWSLTDTPTQPAKWPLPASNVPADGYVVVFASGKDRAIPGQPLHTNFRLSSDNGYLALIRPDGSLASVFGPGYPPQKENVSFGASSIMLTNVFIAGGANVKFFVPSNDALGSTWTGVNEPFDDSATAAWSAGGTGVGYDVSGTANGAALETIGETLVSRSTYDTASGSIFVLATAGFTQAGEVTEWTVFSAVHRDLTPLVLRLEVNGTYTITGIGTPLTSTAGGAQTNAFRLVSGSARVGPGYFFGWKDGSNGANNTGAPAFDNSAASGIRWFQQHTVFAVNENLGAGQFFGRAYSLQATVRGNLSTFVKSNVQSLMLGKNTSIYLRIPFLVGFGQSFDMLELRMNYADGFVAWLNGVEITRRNAPATLTFNSNSLTNRLPTAAGVAEQIDLNEFASLLHSGTNLLAIQGLNYDANGGDFLMLPELVGRKRTSATNHFLGVPTPGAANSAGYSGWVEETKFTPPHGFYWSPIDVALTSATPASVIRFTRDGSRPSETNGTLYTAPIHLTNSATLRAAAFYPGFIPSEVGTHSFLFPALVAMQSANPAGFPKQWSGSPADYEVDPNVTRSTLTGYGLTNALLDIPTLSITADPGDLFDAARGIYYNSSQSGPGQQRAASIEMIFPDGSDGFQADATLRIGGDYSSFNSVTPKHTLRVAFKISAGLPKLHFPLFPEASVQDFDQLALRACSTDSWPIEDPPNISGDGSIRWARNQATYLRDQFMRDSMRDLGQPAAHGRYVQLYLNGLYWGLYNLCEWMNDAWNEEHFGGDKSEYDVIKDFAELEEGNFQAWNAMMALVNAGFPTEAAYQRLQGNNADGTRNPAYPVYLHLENFIDYMILHIYCGAEDWPVHNWWASRRRGSLSEGFRFYPWDQEISNDLLTRTTTLSSGRFELVSAPNTPGIIYDRLRRNPSFQMRFIDRVQELLFDNGQLTAAANSNRWAVRQAEIDKAIVGESARWGDRRREPPYKREVEWLAEMNWEQTVYWPSNHFLAIQRFRRVGLFPLLAPPVLSQKGGSVPSGYPLVMGNSNASGSIFFTTDGSDPRLVSGNVSPRAQTYEIPITINAPTLVRARIHSGTNWSAMITANLFPPQDLTPLRITEIMYHPPTVGLADGDDFEFLELKNRGTNTLDLSGLTFTRGISFTLTNGTRLPPGAFFVLVRAPAQFATKYPGVLVNGVYAGKLGNGGATVTLSYPFDGPAVLSVTYGDLAPWPATADGLGFSLVPLDTDSMIQPDHAIYWRVSANPGGSPGVDDPASTLAPIRINEILSRSDIGQDWIELFNPTLASVNIGGWFLTDDPAVPKKFRIPDNTMLGPLSYAVFNETQFNPDPGTSSSFSLGSHGDQVYLFSGDAQRNLTGYSHGFAFGAAEDGVTFGRYVLSTGEEQFPAQLSSSPGETNRGPRTGPVVINEIHYHPDSDQDEFIELWNVGSKEVPLFDPANPTHTWRFKGLGFDFPTNVVLGPKQFALLVATNPASFRAKYMVPADVQVFGPYAGELQNSGERLELQRPDAPDTNGVPYLTVDEVHYANKSPWPLAANGSGASLQRKNATAYGNDPVNWRVASPSPGRPATEADTDGDGLPDAWEIAYGTNPQEDDADVDPDQDGFSNLQEFWAGTHPNDPASALRIESIAWESDGGTAVLSFRAVSNRTYSVLYHDSLESGLWLALTNVSAAATTRTVNVADLLPPRATRFYRLQTSLPP